MKNARLRSNPADHENGWKLMVWKSCLRILRMPSTIADSIFQWTFQPFARGHPALSAARKVAEWACAFQENRMQIMTFPVRRNYQFTLWWQLVEKLCGNDNFGFASNCLCAKALLTTKVLCQILLQDKRVEGMKCVLMDSCEIVCGSSEKRICQQLYEKLCGAFVWCWFLNYLNVFQVQQMKKKIIWIFSLRFIYFK